jgi:DNA-binding transcriptional LysR family regulator
MADDLNSLSVFAAVVAAKGFRAAGRELGVSGTAVSQTIRQLEERLGVSLLERTTRSVRLTEAGARLYATVGPALDEVRAAEEEVKGLGEEPAGTLRLHISSGAENILRGSLLAGFLTTYPKVRLDLAVSEHTGEIVESGFDAAVGLGEMIERDMVAMPVSGELRMMVAGSPDYLRRRGMPSHPRDLPDHDCINWKPDAHAPPYRWEFTEDGRDFAVNVDARVVTTDPHLNIRLAIAGIGLTVEFDTVLREHFEAGTLVPLLQEFSAPFPGFFLYFPRRRQRPAALRAFIDYVRDRVRS